VPSVNSSHTATTATTLATLISLNVWFAFCYAFAPMNSATFLVSIDFMKSGTELSVPSPF
jgi:hypothetical protein